MRQSFPRPLALVVCALALCLASCSSNNKGKIEGKWKMDSVPGAKEADIKMMAALKVYPYIEFKTDGTFEIGGASDDPEMAKMLAMAGDKGKGGNVKGKYKLLTGSGVELSGIEGEAAKGFFQGKSSGRVEITINGDSLTLKASDGTIPCTRIK